MKHRIIQNLLGRLAVLLVLSAGLLPVRAETFSFNWPAPASAIISESTTLAGVTFEFRQKISVDRRPAAGGYIIANQGVDVVKVTGLPEDVESHVLADSRVMEAFSVWPSYMITDQGELEGFAVAGDPVTELAAATSGIELPAELRKFIVSEHYQQGLRDHMTVLWKAVFGAVNGKSLATGETITRHVKLPWYGDNIPARLETTNLGAAAAVSGTVNVLTTISFEEPALKATMLKVISSVLGRPPDDMGGIESIARSVVFDSTLSAATLLPHRIRMVEDFSMQAAKTRALRTSHVTTLEFEWHP